MAALGHLGVGFAAKPLAPKVPLWVLLLSTEVLDILWFVFYITGIDKSTSMDRASPLSHGLAMALVWSALAAIVAALVYRDGRSTLIIGLLVFSHWIVDLITHPMGAIFGGRALTPDLPLFFNGSRRVGFGLYNHSFPLAVIFDVGMLLIGIAIYLKDRNKKGRLVNESN